MTLSQNVGAKWNNNSEHNNENIGVSFFSTTGWDGVNPFKRQKAGKMILDSEKNLYFLFRKRNIRLLDKKA
jgi:hypothetical protein